MILKYDNMNTTKGREKQKMLYSTDCNYIVRVLQSDVHYECYTKEQVKEHIKQKNGCVVYRVLNNGMLEHIAIIKPYIN